MLASGGKAHDGEDTAQSGAAYVAPDKEQVAHRGKAVYSHIYQHCPAAIGLQKITGGLSRFPQKGAVAFPDFPGAPSREEKACPQAEKAQPHRE